MKYIATVLCMVCVAAVLAAARLSVDALPEPVRPLAEAETNVVFSAGAQGDNIWKLSIELESSVSNCVEVVFGTDANNDGVLGVGEGELCVGWDCGEWFWRDRRSGGAGRTACADGMRRLDWTLRLASDKSARSVDGNVFSGVVAPTCFNPDWNVARIVSRGAEGLRVESKVTVDALKLRVR
jgi:hypothetical protein